nr:MAG TPA: hypothetical protein [Bacteriophage sp.]
MTLKNYMDEHFFDTVYPCKFIADGEELNIGHNEYDNYEFIKKEIAEADAEEIIYVRKI